MTIHIIGAGVMGLTLATELVSRGAEVKIYEQSSSIGGNACSWFAGGMLAPWCERESAEPAVLNFGRMAKQWWSRHLNTGSDQVIQQGTLVLAQARDVTELNRFSRRTDNYEWVTGEQIDVLEPDLATRFNKGLFFSEEAHLDPRKALITLAKNLTNKGVEINFGTHVEPSNFTKDIVVDCRGIRAKPDWSGIRGVKGEMLIVRCEEISLQRPVRLLHPRIPLYIVPRANQHFMIGATMLENTERDRFSVRSMLELLSSVYALHPSFAEAEIIEMGVDTRPAFPDNLPRIENQENLWRLNGLYRHGFLLSPALAVEAASSILNKEHKLEQMYECHC